MWLRAEAPVIGLGCMRLSTERDRDDERSTAVLHAALDAGITLLDTADAYCWHEGESGHNERLIAAALAAWAGDRSRIVLASKGGLTRPQGNWVEDGRAKHLTAACEASLRALRLDRIPLYQLHAPDPRTPFSTSVRALAALQQAGLVDRVGLCNVTLGQIEEARRHVEVASVQVELSLWHDDALRNGVVPYCIAHGIYVLAHRPLGGLRRRRRTSREPLLIDLAARHEATPFEIALAWLRDLSPLIIPLPGATRIDTPASIARSARLRVTGADRARLDDRFPAGRRLRTGGRPAAADLRRADGEVVLIMGLPAAGKSTLAKTLTASGYTRLNRDDTGGSLAGLLPALERTIAEGSTRIVVDNTYVSRAARAGVVEAAARHGLPARCLWLATSLEDAQVNAVARMLARHERLLMPEEIKVASRRDPATFGPSAQFRQQRALEPPHPSEGFSRVETVPFERRHDPSFTNRAIVLWCDGVLHRSTGGRLPTAEDVAAVAERGTLLRRYQADGWKIFGLSWQPAIAAGELTWDEAEAGYERLRQLLGLENRVLFCPHAAGPPICWCRKPLPGLGVVLVQRHRLDPGSCIYVGGGPQDPGFARRLGFRYRHADEFFAGAGRI